MSSASPTHWRTTPSARIAQLPPLDRALLLLYLDQHSYRDIGEVLGISETNVATNLSRLKARMRAER